MTGVMEVIAGFFFGAFVWYPLGRLSLLVLYRGAWRRERQLAARIQRPAPVRVRDAGQYAQPRSVSNGVEPLADRQFRVR